MLRLILDLVTIGACGIPLLAVYLFWPDWLWAGCVISLSAAYCAGMAFGVRDDEIDGDFQ